MEAGYLGAGILFFLIYGAIVIAYLGISIYCIVLFIKLATRGIKALDIYNAKNGDGEVQMGMLPITIIYGVIYIPFFTIGFVMMVLAIKLMKRGIVALDNYLDANS